ncbi:MAG: 50S ribosomal protein L9 [Clostridia bacterium]|nr:50S ribosomal protein L9 [Clostridia bacterium]
MKVLLLSDVRGSGKMNDIVEVSDGYARNFLIKKGLAKQADDSLLKEKASQLASKARNVMLQKEEAEKTAKILKNKTFVIHANVGTNGKMFGAVTSKEIASAINSEGIEVDRRDIILKTPIKNVGSYVIESKLFAGVVAKFNIIVE